MIDPNSTYEVRHQAMSFAVQLCQLDDDLIELAVQIEGFLLGDNSRLAPSPEQPQDPDIFEKTYESAERPQPETAGEVNDESMIEQEADSRETMVEGEDSFDEAVGQFPLESAAEFKAADFMGFTVTEKELPDGVLAEATSANGEKVVITE